MSRAGNRPIPLGERFWVKVDASGDCWQWTAFIDPDGYGSFRVTGVGHRRAHRVAWEALVGPIPEALTVDHRCRNRGCVNPDHLELVPNKVNILRGYGPPALAARSATCAQGHDLTDPANVYTPPSRPNRRKCRQCARERQSVDQERARGRYATDPAYRERRLAKNNASRRNRAAG